MTADRCCITPCPVWGCSAEQPSRVSDGTCRHWPRPGPNKAASHWLIVCGNPTRASVPAPDLTASVGNPVGHGAPVEGGASVLGPGAWRLARGGCGRSSQSHRPSCGEGDMELVVCVPVSQRCQRAVVICHPCRSWYRARRTHKRLPASARATTCLFFLHRLFSFSTHCLGFRNTFELRRQTDRQTDRQQTQDRPPPRE